MPECEKCPIREECDEEKEDIIRRTTGDKEFMRGALDYCPILEYLYTSLKRNIGE